MNTATPLSPMQFTPVHLVSAPPQTPSPALLPISEPWPVGYTMTVWGVAIGVTVLISLMITTWLRLSPHARALAVQSLAWRLSPSQLLALRSVTQVSRTPASVLLISRGAFESAVTSWAMADEGALVTARKRASLASLSARLFGPQQA